MFTRAAILFKSKSPRLVLLLLLLFFDFCAVLRDDDDGDDGAGAGRELPSVSFSISSPKDTARGTPALRMRTAAAPPMGALRFGASPRSERMLLDEDKGGVERKSPEGGCYHHPPKIGDVERVGPDRTLIHFIGAACVYSIYGG